MNRFECIGGPADGMFVERTDLTIVLMGHEYTLFARLRGPQVYVHRDLVHFYCGRKNDA